MNDLRLFVDTEYAYDEMTAEYGRPKGHEQIQIVQIAAILFDMKNCREVATFDILVRPTYLTKLPPFFIELTHISQEDISRDGVSFTEAFHSFSDFVKDYPIWTFEKDEAVFRKNCSYHNLTFPFSVSKVKPLLHNYNIDAEEYSSGTLYKAANIEITGHVHNALHDVRSMSQALCALERC